MKRITDKIILGIDPGTVIMGYGLIHVSGREMKLIALDVIKLQKLGDHTMRLQKIFETVTKLVKEHKPDELAIEAPFFGKNVQSMLKLGRAQGVAMAAGLNFNIPIIEYSPKKIKQSITGSGNASKEQVSAMLQQLLKIDKPDYFDATDALAVAVCHHFQSNGLSSAKKSFKNWGAFLSANPDRKI
ncbi:MAG TPA: crossover junction endodeoxyribonuclease RuvC [Bacteroidia bacterium]|nr:crossover junction endodeoxyribonuclease RuvC [Bacteroidia bacterium]